MKKPVTLVRRKITYEQIVMEREEFDKLDDKGVYKVEMDKDFCFEFDSVEHFAFEGDVSLLTLRMMNTSDADWARGKPDRII